MGTKVAVDPGRINCPTCGAAAGHCCVAVAVNRDTNEIELVEPLRGVIGYHSGRKWAAKHGRV